MYCVGLYCTVKYRTYVLCNPLSAQRRVTLRLFGLPELLKSQFLIFSSSVLSPFFISITRSRIQLSSKLIYDLLSNFLLYACLFTCHSPFFLPPLHPTSSLPSFSPTFLSCMLSSPLYLSTAFLSSIFYFSPHSSLSSLLLHVHCILVLLILFSHLLII